MQATTVVDTTRILGKGPDYLRQQIEGETKGRLSAVERLAASKPNYVKSLQVTDSAQSPLITYSSASVSSNGSSERSSKLGTVRSTTSQNIDTPSECLSNEETNVVRRSSSKKRRPDSLLMYRQKCEKGSTNENARGSLVRRLFLSSLKEKPATLPEVMVKESPPKGNNNKSIESEKSDSNNTQTQLTANVQRSPIRLTAEETEGKSRRAVLRSHSDISSRYSKNFSQFETFFKYCGLDGEVVESLGKDNFSAHSDETYSRNRSVSVSTSDDQFTRESGDSCGVLDELGEKVRQETSVVERNARIIKWLYSCKNAKESGKVLRDLE